MDLSSYRLQLVRVFMRTVFAMRWLKLIVSGVEGLRVSSLVKVPAVWRIGEQGQVQGNVPIWWKGRVEVSGKVEVAFCIQVFIFFLFEGNNICSLLFWLNHTCSLVSSFSSDHLRWIFFFIFMAFSIWHQARLVTSSNLWVLIFLTDRETSIFSLFVSPQAALWCTLCGIFYFKSVSCMYSSVITWFLPQLPEP